MNQRSQTSGQESSQASNPTSFRIAYGRINQESHSLNPVGTTLDDIAQTHLLEGQALHQACQKSAMEAEGFLKNAELSGFVGEIGKLQKKVQRKVELVPLLSAWAVPGGPLTKACFEGLCDRMLAGLKNTGPVDAVYLSLHGAMGVEGRPGAEAEIVRRVRDVVGDVPIVVTLDLHANVTRELVALTDAIIAYRTNPHRDHVKTGARAATMLIGLLQKTIAPHTAWRSLPMLLGGGITLDFAGSMRKIFQQVKKIDKNPSVLAVSVFMCHPWNDHQELGWSVVIVTDGDPALAERLADDLAERCWNVRHDLPPTFKSAEVAIAKARASRWARKLGIVAISDASDVVTAGSTGENTRFIAALLEHGQGLLSYAGIRDPEVVEALWEKEAGAQVEVAVGGKLDPDRNSSLPLKAQIVRKVKNLGVGRTVVLAVGDLRLVVVEGPCLIIAPSFYKNAGLALMKADIVMVKNYFPFLIYFLPYMRKTIFVRTEGITDFDAVHQLSFAGPVWPRDDVSDWREADARRRGPKPEATVRQAA